MSPNDEVDILTFFVLTFVEQMGYSVPSDRVLRCSTISWGWFFFASDNMGIFSKKLPNIRSLGKVLFWG